MLSLSYNISERCYLEAAKKTFEVGDEKGLCEKIDVRFSYGTVSIEEYEPHYDPQYWLLRKISWIVTVPFRLIAALAALINSAFDFFCGDTVALKINFYSSVCMLEYAAGDFISIFHDRIGQQLATEAYVHIKLYFLALQSPQLRQKAYDAWFRMPIEVAAEIIHNARRAGDDTLPGWAKHIISLENS